MTEQERQQRTDKLRRNALALASSFLPSAGDANGKKTFVCPKCGRGGENSKHKDGLQVSEIGAYYCFSCDFEGRDIIALYMGTTGKPFTDAITELEALNGDAENQTPTKAPKKQPPVQVDYSEFFRKCASHITDTNYHRGISLDTLKKYHVGYCSEWVNPATVESYKAKYHSMPPASPRLIIPTSRSTYVARRTDGHNEKNYYPKLVVGARYPFNLQALKESHGKPVFVVEGEIDALSIIDVGGLAVGLGGSSGSKYLLHELERNPFPYLLVLVADSDAKKDKEYRNLNEKIKSMGVQSIVIDGSSVFGGSKDGNDALNHDRNALEVAIRDIENTRKAAVLNPWAGGVQSLIDKVQGEKYKPTPTGIESLDKILQGGFVNQQLIGITGRPGAGKTAFCQFLVESMALNRDDFSVVYLCFEMSAEQLQARSISRLMYSAGQDLAPIEILQGKGRWREGAETYNSLYSDKVCYLGVGGGLNNSDITEVERVIGECILYNATIGRPAPYIVVDYLQIVSVPGRNEFEAIGEIMSRLKGLAVKYNTVVLLVIANNRDANKKCESDMFSGRGSGSIEYGADILLSLQPEEDMLTQEGKRVSVKVAKGRWIEPDKTAGFVFDGKHMTYKPIEIDGAILPRKEQKAANDLFNITK